ncbi:MAG: acylphosphatase [Bdellovibrionales bacterium]|nr:acylphosphatase [Bdellovibrionales bacterium]
MEKYYLVKGLVQGVGYRQFVKQTANQLSITGWVRNLKTQDVEVLAFTDETTHNKLFKALLSGPNRAQVKEVLQKQISSKNTQPDGFEVLETREKPCYEL